MIQKIYRYLFFLLPAFGFMLVGTANGQTLSTDSLSLNSIISEVVQNHPLVRKAMEDLNNADAKIGLAQSANLPNVDIESSYSRIGPVPEITIPDMGSFSFVPHDNYSASLNANKMLYDFGKTEKSILLEKQGKVISVKTIEQVKQKLSQAVISNYFALVFFQEAVKIKDEELVTLNEHLHFVQKKLESGSATNYEILTTQVRISAIENQKTDLITAKQMQMTQLNSLLGKPESKTLHVKNKMGFPVPEIQTDTLIAAALINRDEMKLAGEKTTLANLRYKLTNAQNNAVFSAFLSGGIKNGYTPYLYDPKANFVAGLGLKVPLFDGYRKKYNLVQAQSSIESINQDTEIARRTIVDEVIEAEANLGASKKKVTESELQLKQAMQAYDLAKVKFDSGVITNLELIDNSNSISLSKLMLLKSKIDHTVNIYKLRYAIGERLY
ncbi:MAG: TolC family protein [Bacteroidia bacterium]